MSVRVRFAPSPTGHLHIGGARTALFNWLFSRQKQGVFVLRIEDTDVERSSTEMVEGILDGMRWLGLCWDEGPYFQSERLKLYQSVCQQLLQQGSAYRCFCGDPGEGKERDYRDDQASDPCRDLPGKLADEWSRAGRDCAVRFRAPDTGKVSFEDRVFGVIDVDAPNLPDFVIQRSDGTPTYHLSVVADDIDMGISHVIRGVDHLSNTAKHVLLFQSLEKAVPQFVHLPLILGPDKKRLSKRHGATSVIEFRRQGFLPQAVRNYLALLGWSSGDDQELFSEAALVSRFSLDRINKANAVFDVQKLEWMNGRLLSELDASELEPEVRRVLQENGLWREEWREEMRGWFLSTVGLLKKGSRKLTDFAELGRAFFSDNFTYDESAVSKYLHRPEEESAQLAAALAQLGVSYAELEPFDLETTEAALRKILTEHDLKAGMFIGAVRVAMTGKAHAPGIFDVIVALGKERTIKRLQSVENLVRSS